MNKLALISVFNKKGIVDFAKNLEGAGWGIVASGGTYRTLKSAKIKASHLEKITGSPEILEGRIKTISYQVAAGILFDRSKRKQRREMEKSHLQPIDMVVCNLYPFEKTTSNKRDLKDAIEMIDIGGVTLLRAAAKNFKDVIVVSDPDDYQEIIYKLEVSGKLDDNIKTKLASKAFEYVTRYDSSISRYFAKHFGNSIKLRYGENPHQKAWFHEESTTDPLAIQNFKQIQGKGLSFNNILDVSAVIAALAEVGGTKPACVIVKHGSPAGGAVAGSIENAYKNAWFGGDPIAAFGGIIGVNREVDDNLALQMLIENGRKKFFEVLLTPKISPEAQKIFSVRKKLTILHNKALQNPKVRRGKDFKYVRGGVLEQDFDSKILTEKNLKVVTHKRPTKKQITDLLFAWMIVKVSKSNAIAISKNQTLVSSGVGQQDRKEAARIAVFKATDLARGKTKKTPIGAVAASDAFFPFPDGPELLIKAGIKAIIQPGGSIRDQDTIDLCNKYGVSMAFTNIRSFKH